MKRATLPLYLAAFLLLAGVVLANGTPTIDWNVMGSGGQFVEAAPHALEGTIGQAVVGPATDTGSELCAGFWCGVAVRYETYLPLVLRQS